MVSFPQEEIKLLDSFDSGAARKESLINLFSRNKFFPRQFNILENFSKEPFAQIFTFMGASPRSKNRQAAAVSNSIGTVGRQTKKDGGIEYEGADKISNLLVEALVDSGKLTGPPQLAAIVFIKRGSNKNPLVISEELQSSSNENVNDGGAADKIIKAFQDYLGKEQDVLADVKSKWIDEDPFVRRAAPDNSGFMDNTLVKESFIKLLIFIHSSVNREIILAVANEVASHGFKAREYLEYISEIKLFDYLYTHKVAPEFLELMGKGFFPDEYLLSLYAQANEKDKIVEQWKREIKLIKEGGFDFTNRLHISLGWTILKHKKLINPFAHYSNENEIYEEYLAAVDRVRGAGNFDDIYIKDLPSNIRAEVIFLQEESMRLKQFLSEIKIRALELGLELVVIGNMSNVHALLPILGFLHSEGIKLSTSHIGSTGCWEDSFFVEAGTFKENVLEPIAKGAILVIVDGSSSVGSISRFWLSHYANAYLGFYNFMHAVNKLSGKRVAINKKDEYFIPFLEKDSHFRETVFVLKRVAELCGVKKMPFYKFHFWHPGWRWLKIRSYNRKWDTLAPPSIALKKIDGPCFIFTQTFLESSSISLDTKLKAGRIFHKTGFFDNTNDYYSPISLGVDLRFSAAEIKITRRGPIFFNNFTEWMYKTYWEIEKIDGSDTAIERMVSSSRDVPQGARLSLCNILQNNKIEKGLNPIKSKYVDYDPQKIIKVEIGFGKLGDFLFENASASSEELWIGMEVHPEALHNAKERIKETGVRNIKIIPVVKPNDVIVREIESIENFSLDGLGLIIALENHLKAGSISGFYINYPNTNIVIFDRELLEKLYSYLTFKGEIVIVTESKDYADAIVNSFSRIKGFDNYFSNLADGYARGKLCHFKDKGWVYNPKPEEDYRLYKSRYINDDFSKVYYLRFIKQRGKGDGSVFTGNQEAGPWEMQDGGKSTYPSIETIKLQKELCVPEEILAASEKIIGNGRGREVLINKIINRRRDIPVMAGCIVVSSYFPRKEAEIYNFGVKEFYELFQFLFDKERLENLSEAEFNNFWDSIGLIKVEKINIKDEIKLFADFFNVSLEHMVNSYWSHPSKLVEFCVKMKSQRGVLNSLNRVLRKEAAAYILERNPFSFMASFEKIENSGIAGLEKEIKELKKDYGFLFDVDFVCEDAAKFQKEVKDILSNINMLKLTADSESAGKKFKVYCAAVESLLYSLDASFIDKYVYGRVLSRILFSARIKFISDDEGNAYDSFEVDVKLIKKLRGNQYQFLAIISHEGEHNNLEIKAQKLLLTRKIKDSDIKKEYVCDIARFTILEALGKRKEIRKIFKERIYFEPDNVGVHGIARKALLDMVEELHGKNGSIKALAKELAQLWPLKQKSIRWHLIQKISRKIYFSEPELSFPEFHKRVLSEYKFSRRQVEKDGGAAQKPKKIEPSLSALTEGIDEKTAKEVICKEGTKNKAHAILYAQGKIGTDTVFSSKNSLKKRCLSLFFQLESNDGVAFSGGIIKDDRCDGEAEEEAQVLDADGGNSADAVYVEKTSYGVSVRIGNAQHRFVSGGHRQDYSRMPVERAIENAEAVISEGIRLPEKEIKKMQDKWGYGQTEHIREIEGKGGKIVYVDVYAKKLRPVSFHSIYCLVMKGILIFAYIIAPDILGLYFVSSAGIYLIPLAIIGLITINFIAYKWFIQDIEQIGIFYPNPIPDSEIRLDFRNLVWAEKLARLPVILGKENLVTANIIGFFHESGVIGYLTNENLRIKRWQYYAQNRQAAALNKYLDLDKSMEIIKTGAGKEEIIGSIAGVAYVNALLEKVNIAKNDGRLDGGVEQLKHNVLRDDHGVNVLANALPYYINKVPNSWREFCKIKRKLASSNTKQCRQDLVKQLTWLAQGEKDGGKENEITIGRSKIPSEESRIIAEILAEVKDKKSVNINRLYLLGLVKEPYFFHIISGFLNPFVSDRRRQETRGLLLEAAELAPKRFVDILDELKIIEKYKDETKKFIRALYETPEFLEIAKIIFKEKIKKELSEYESVTQADIDYIYTIFPKPAAYAIRFELTRESGIDIDWLTVEKKLVKIRNFYIKQKEKLDVQYHKDEDVIKRSRFVGVLLNAIREIVVPIAKEIYDARQKDLIVQGQRQGFDGSKFALVAISSDGSQRYNINSDLDMALIYEKDFYFNQGYYFMGLGDYINTLFRYVGLNVCNIHNTSHYDYNCTIDEYVEKFRYLLGKKDNYSQAKFSDFMLKFFDARLIYGDKAVFEKFNQATQPLFYSDLFAQKLIHALKRIKSLKKISGEAKERTWLYRFNLKNSGIRLIDYLVWILRVKYKIEEIKRREVLRILAEKGILSFDDYQKLIDFHIAVRNHMNKIEFQNKDRVRNELIQYNDMLPPYALEVKLNEIPEDLAAVLIKTHKLVHKIIKESFDSLPLGDNQAHQKDGGRGQKISRNIFGSKLLILSTLTKEWYTYRSGQELMPSNPYNRINPLTPMQPIRQAPSYSPPSIPAIPAGGRRI